MKSKRITLLGATGSIGTSAVDVIERHPQLFEVKAVTAQKNVQALAKLAIKTRAQFAAIASDAEYKALKDALAGTGIEAAAGSLAVTEAGERDSDIVVAAISGSAGLAPTLAAARRGATIALANKECLVAAGELFMRTAQESGATILPVDSEHSGVFQALLAGRKQDVTSVTLTASGGPFRTCSHAALQTVTVQDALRHPTWKMGAKVTIDSATLMNKGLELIEAHHLFDISPHELKAVVHPQSLVHALVTFCDGSVVAQLSTPDMRMPIALALSWPERIETGVKPLDLAAIGSLTFEPVDDEKFPCLALAQQAMQQGGAAPSILNAANEAAVAAFLRGDIGFMQIAQWVSSALNAVTRNHTHAPQSLAELLALEAEVGSVLASSPLRKVKSA